MKTINFTFITIGTNEDEVKAKMAAMVGELKEKCDALNLELRDGRIFNAGRILISDGEVEARYDLCITKRKGITYREIYKMVNSIKPVYFLIK